MRLSSASELLAYTRNTEKWTSELVVQHNNASLNISSAAQGKISKTPSDAPDQPTRYPRNSVYRFDVTFKGVDSWPRLKRMLSGFKCCPGCKLSTTQSHIRRKASSLRGGEWRIGCSKARPQTKPKEGAFEEGKHAMSNIPVQQIKKCKSKGSTFKGVEGMYSKTVRTELRQDNKRKAAQS